MEQPRDEPFEETLHAARGGDPDALDALARRFGEALLRRIRLLMGPRARNFAESGDFLQEVFVEAMASLDRFEAGSSRAFVSWLTQLARNRIRKSIRRARERAVETVATESIVARNGAGPHTNAMVQEEVARLVEAMAELPEQYQEVLELRYFEQLPFPEIAVRMGRSENAVQLLNARGMTMLGQRMRALLGGEPGLP